MKRTPVSTFAGGVAAMLLMLAAPLWAEAVADRPFLSPMFGDHMVMQRDKPNRLWGWTTPGAAVRVSIATASASAVAGQDGRWQVEINPPRAGGPYAVKVEGPQTVALQDVLVGDVWLCAGQSNMAFGLMDARDGAAEVSQASHANLRLFRLPQKVSYGPTRVPGGAWKRCEPEAFQPGNGGGFSAVAYYFGRRLHQELGVPIGLIQDAVGGTPAESWMDPSTLAHMADFVPAMAEIERLKARGEPEYGNYVMHWFDEYDRGIEGGTWADESIDTSSWTDVVLPGGFGELGVAETPAVVWFRREVTLPDPVPEGQARVYLGVVEKMDTTHINGRWVGASSWVENPRIYRIPADVLRPGRNSITIRVLKTRRDGGFQSPGDTLRLVLGDGTVIPLAGAWKGKLSVDARAPHPMPLGYENYPTMPAVLYQGMLQPVAPLAITGALWYQGEANFTRAFQYRTLLPAMIADWRALFGQGDFPFYIASLPAFMARKEQPGDDAWAELREAQAITARTVPNSGLAVTVDTGDADNIHPKEKRPVGERLALCALRDTYGRPVVASGPTFAGLEKLPSALRIRFDHIDGGLISSGEGEPGEFAIAGADRVWHRASARLRDNTIIVSSSEVLDPVAVRYAWQANPRATLFNGAGLPAEPFRTDDWPLSTEAAR